VYSVLGCSTATCVFQADSTFGSFSTSSFQSSQTVEGPSTITPESTTQRSSAMQTLDIPTQARVSIPIVVTQTQKAEGGSGASVSIPALPTESTSSRIMSRQWRMAVGIVLAILLVTL
jgi:hypothetical protein